MMDDSDFPGYYPDPDHPGLVRWWDGDEWTDIRATRIDSDELRAIRGDVDFIRLVVQWWAILSLLGLAVLVLGII